MHARLQETFALAQQYNRAMSMDDVYDITLKRLRRFGVTSVLAGIIPNEIVKPADQPKYVVLGEWPDEWAARYFSLQYVRRDPTILHAATQFAPLFWDQIDVSQPDSPAARIMNEAREFKLQDGVTIPQLTLDGVRIGVSFAGERIDRSPEAQTEYVVIAAYAVGRAMQIRAMLIEQTPQPLTLRQRECLMWAASGLTNADIAYKLGISTKIVERRLAGARARLGALTTTQAVSQAIRHGSIH